LESLNHLNGMHRVVIPTSVSADPSAQTTPHPPVFPESVSSDARCEYPGSSPAACAARLNPNARGEDPGYQTSARAGRIPGNRKRPGNQISKESSVWLVGLTTVLTWCVVVAGQPVAAQTTTSREPVVSVTALSAGARVAASIRIDATPATVWGIMLDCKKTARIVAGLERCTVVRRDPAGTWDVREHIVNWSAFLPNVRSEFRSEYVTHERISFRRTAGDLKTLNGSWQLIPLNGGAATKLVYAVDVDPGVPVPGAWVRDAAERDARAVLKALQREAEASPNARTNG
jgi:carbon monoxide dehydrogenase subunit G